jgi:hypothetical protein
MASLATDMTRGFLDDDADATCVARAEKTASGGVSNECGAASTQQGAMLADLSQKWRRRAPAKIGRPHRP